MSLEEALLEHTAALKENTEILKRVVAGQQAALDKLDGAKASTTRTRKAKDEPAAEEPAKVEETKPAATEEPAPATSFFTVPDSVDGFKDYVTAWTGEVDKDSPERAKRVDLLRSIAQNFGVNPKFPELFPHAKEAIFYIERHKAGLKVDFGTDYDFDGDPKQGGGAAAADDDEFG